MLGSKRSIWVLYKWEVNFGTLLFFMDFFFISVKLYWINQRIIQWGPSVRDDWFQEDYSLYWRHFEEKNECQFYIWSKLKVACVGLKNKFTSWLTFNLDNTRNLSSIFFFKMSSILWTILSKLTLSNKRDLSV